MAVEEEQEREGLSVEVSGPARGVAHVALAGELDLVSAPLAQRRMAELLARGVDDVVLHLTGVTFVDSSGLRALLAIDEAAASVGTTLRILPGGPHLMAVVEAAGLLGRLPFAERDQP